MNLRLLFCIGMGLFTTYIGVVMLLSALRSEPLPAPPPPPNFSAKAATVMDPETGEKTIYREITVSTKIAPGSPTPPPENPQD
ncbi:MAG: hypothetical protein K8R23_06040 [Chthoniobacter sp.]|nr:hypothetical protein [Chthoniobacter sp.]